MRRKTAKKQRKRSKIAKQQPLVDRLPNKKRIIKTGEKSLRNWSVFEKKIREIIYKYGILPSGKRLADLGYSDVGAAIMRHHGGFMRFRSKLKEYGIEEGKPKNLDIKIRKFSPEEVNYIKRRRKQLMKEGKYDTEIARILSKELKRAASSITNKISECEEENPNKRNILFTDEEVEQIKKLRAQYIKQGFWDTKIAKLIHKKFGRNETALIAKLSSLVETGEISRNLNAKCSEKRKTYTQVELEKIKSRRTELISQGLLDGEIARVIAPELGRTAATLREKFRNMKESKELSPNPNQRVSYTSKQNKEIFKLWNAVHSEGMRNKQIFEIIGAEHNISLKSIETKIERLKKRNNIRERKPNFVFRYSEAEIEIISQMRQKLISGGWKDWPIAKKIAEKINRPAASINLKISKLVKEGKIGKNPNMPFSKKRKRSSKAKVFTPYEILHIKKRRESLIHEGIGDYAIARKIAPDLGRKLEAVAHKIFQMQSKGELDKNPNNRGYTETQIELIKHVRAKLILRKLKDSEIARQLSTMIGKTEGSLRERIRKMIREKELPLNPYRDKRTKSERPKRFFQEMSDKQIIAYGKEYIIKIKAKTRNDLKNENSGLHEELRKRKLLSHVFGKSDKSRKILSEKELRSGLFRAADAMEQFGDSE